MAAMRQGTPGSECRFGWLRLRPRSPFSLDIDVSQRVSLHSRKCVALLAWIQGFAESLGGPGLFVIAYLDSSFLSFPEVCDV
jgi:hypothetical protein